MAFAWSAGNPAQWQPILSDPVLPDQEQTVSSSNEGDKLTSNNHNQLNAVLPERFRPAASSEGDQTAREGPNDIWRAPNIEFKPFDVRTNLNDLPMPPKPPKPVEAPKTLLDVEIDRMKQAAGPSPESDARERLEFYRLSRLHISATSGDTLIIVGFPNGAFVDCEGRKWATKRFLMDSTKLLATGSTVFKDMLSDEGQAQTRRRLQTDSENRPFLRQAEFVLDLTPQDEGDDSAQLIIQMSLSKGVIDWWTSRNLIGVSKYLVSGHDDHCPYHSTVLISHSEAQAGGHRWIRNKNIADVDYPAPRRIEDYCPVRHRAAILRLLLAIQDGELVLNSAPRVVTMTEVAKYFNCESVVRDHVLSWLSADPNLEFVQLNAEDALKIGWALELPLITRAAFQILVAEKAVNIFGNDLENRNSITWGRPRGRVTDEQEDCIQHAAQYMAQRATDTFHRLQSPTVDHFLELHEWLRVKDRVRYQDHDWVQNWATYLVEQAIWARRVSTPSIWNDLSYYIRPTDFVPTGDLLQRLQGPQWLLTSEFWTSIAIYATDDYHYDKTAGHVVDRLNIDWPSLFDKHKLRADFKAAFENLGRAWKKSEMETIASQVPWVASLAPEELKFLPLWAGGSNDGSGHVFELQIPAADFLVPIAPGPGFVTGQSLASQYTESTMRSESVYTDCDTVTMTEGFSVIPEYPAPTTVYEYANPQRRQGASNEQAPSRYPNQSATTADTTAAGDASDRALPDDIDIAHFSDEPDEPDDSDDTDMEDDF